MKSFFSLLLFVFSLLYFVSSTINYAQAQCKSPNYCTSGPCSTGDIVIYNGCGGNPVNTCCGPGAH